MQLDLEAASWNTDRSTSLADVRLEGELAVLEEAWREAEEIARISDDLLVPKSVRRTLERWRSSEGVRTGDDLGSSKG